jgi:hypothetical protein
MLVSDIIRTQHCTKPLFDGEVDIYILNSMKRNGNYSKEGIYMLKQDRSE